MTNLPPIEYGGRADSVRAMLHDHASSALLITDLTNVRWLTGVQASNAAVALLPDRLVLVTDFRYRDKATDEMAEAGVDGEVIAGFTAAEQFDVLTAALGPIGKVGAESAKMTHRQWEAYAAHLDLVPGDGLVERGRRRKGVGEIARIEAAAAAADRALADVAPGLDGMTEGDVRRELEYRMRLYGADGPSYDTIVASGPDHAARPHHGAEQRRIGEGDTVVIDVGGLVDGYHSDMTRSYVIGEASTEQAELYSFLLDVQLAGLGAVAAGVPAREVDATCRDLIERAGFGEWFIHSTGHGVGLQIHEDPFEAPSSTAELQVGDVVTVEPGLYRVGFGGFRIEDLVEVTDTGCRILTHSPKDSPCPPSPPTT